MKEEEILANVSGRLGIKALNAMQRKMLANFDGGGDVVLLSPTGSGKTIAYLIPVLKGLREPVGQVQAVVIAPSRELVMQIGEIARQLATGHKVTCCYGGHNVADEKQSLSVVPSIIVSTPGRMLDHINRGHVDVSSVSMLVLDEFDKSLELGFQDEMKRVLGHMRNVSRRVLTSATMIDSFPDFLKLSRVRTFNFLDGNKQVSARIKVWKVISPERDKLATVLALLGNLPNSRSIIFANYREAAERIYKYLSDSGVSAGLYHGGLDQQEREVALTLFENGTHIVLVTTDLGSRGLDIAGVTAIVHYHLPVSQEAYIHRNGRTARVAAEGEVFVVLGPDEVVPEYMSFDGQRSLEFDNRVDLSSGVASLYFQAGKKEKLSRGDIVGFIANNGGITAREIGQISLYDHYAIVAVPRSEVEAVLERISRLKIKNKRVRISIIG